MTAEQAREYETNCTLIAELDKEMYDSIMKRVAEAISDPEENKRSMVWRLMIPRRVRNKLKQDHFQINTDSEGVTTISWEPLTTES
jgi:hypothetical protein